MDIEMIEEKLDELFADAIDVEDTIWYSETETLRDAILNMIDSENITQHPTMKLQFTLLPFERLRCAHCDRLMEDGDIVHIVPDPKIVLFRCWDCTRQDQVKKQEEIHGIRN